MPVINELLKDESSDVRLSSISHLLKIVAILGLTIINPPFLTTLTTLTKDS